MFAHLLRKTGSRPTGAANAKVYTMPAPIGGWNARDALSAMKPEDAIILENIIPGHGKVRVRDGFLSHATGIAGSYVESLMEYAPPTGTNRLFAAGPSDIYEVTSAGAVGAAVVTGMNNGRWQHVMMAALGGNYLCIVNGSNGYRTFDGTTWTNQNAAVTGVTTGAATASDTTTFVNVGLHANRLWFVQTNSLDAWYLPVASITGAASKFPLGPLCKEGGYLLAIGTWTKDAGDGMDDLIAFVTSKGQVVVYQGTDPSDSALWQLVGVYKVAEPIGRRCVIKVGGDIGIVTATGVALLSALIGANLSGQRKVAITNKITEAFTDAYLTAGSNHGWQIQEFPSQALVLVNVPVQERTTSYQYVINIETGAWCLFTGINALAWSLRGSDLFFGGADGAVYQYGIEKTDNGEPIAWKFQTAFNRLKGNNIKVFRMIRTLLLSVAGYVPGVHLMFNYDTASPTPETPLADGEGPPWDTTPWDSSPWGASVEESATWQTVDGSGRSVSVVIAGRSSGITTEFNEIDLMAEDGSWL